LNRINYLLTELVPLVPAGADLENAYHGTHNPYLVLLSILIAAGAAYASFSHTSLMQQTPSRAMRYVWMLSGAITMGLGVWAMHFTGMLSYQLPFTLSYEPQITAISVIPAIIAGAVTLWILNTKRLTAGKTLLAGTVMGAGIGTMHYVGMAGVLVPATMLYKPGWFYSSILAAVVLATVSLTIPYKLQERFRHSALITLFAAMIMGAAIASMHYITMHATIFLPPEPGQRMKQMGC